MSSLVPSRALTLLTQPGRAARALIVAIIPMTAFAEGVDGNPAPNPICAFTSSDFATVTEVVDGDTLRLADGRVVRLAGTEAPKAYNAPSGVHISAAGLAAHRALQRLSMGQRVKIDADAQGTDRHGRILAEITLEDGTWLQEAMVSQGLVRVRPFATESQCLGRLRIREREAREARRGIWKETEFSILSAYDPSLVERKGLYVIVEGRVISVGHGERVDFLNFGRKWRSDFTVLVASSAVRLLEETGRSTDTMVGKRVRVRGIIEESGGPAIRLNNPDEIEILDDD